MDHPNQLFQNCLQSSKGQFEMSYDFALFNGSKWDPPFFVFTV